MGLISLSVFKVLMQIHDGHFEALVNAAHGVIEGKPHWIAYQNRLLGPYTVYFISKLGLSFHFSLKIYILSMVFLQNITLFFLIRHMNIKHQESLAWVILYCFAFILVQHYWFYTWDSLDAIIFTLFAWGIFNVQSPYYFAIIFCVALLNRESAIFISLYILIDAFNFKSAKEPHFVSLKKLLIGISLILAGLAYTKAIRHYLFISKPNGQPDTAHELIGNHIYLSQNLLDLFVHNAFSLEIINSAFIIISTLYFSSLLARSHSDKQIKALLIFFAIIANILTFGLINETRMFIILIPFVIFLLLSKSPAATLHRGR
ncbi:MAG: hypothetical protein ACP5R6_02310 [Chlorobaculum sp.]